jgi:hypothetical protein
VTGAERVPTLQRYQRVLRFLWLRRHIVPRQRAAAQLSSSEIASILSMQINPTPGVSGFGLPLNVSVISIKENIL